MTRLRTLALLPALFVVVLVACPADAGPTPGPSGQQTPASAAVGPPGAESCPVFPADNVWHSDISTLPVHARSAAWMSSMNSVTTKLHPDMGDSGDPMPYGIPWNVVAGNHPKVSIDFYYPDESDPGPYPFDQNTPVEGGSDRHALTIDRDNCKLYELYDVEYSPSGSTGGSGAIFDLRSNALRAAGDTSADAAGLPIFAGLVRQDEVARGVIDHAIRFTASRTDRSYVWPARHQAGAANDPNLPPMGARFRLKPSFSLTGYRADTQVFLRAFKSYGVILADNGSNWFFTGAAEPGWDNDLLDELKTIPASAFEAVDASSLMVSPDSGQFRTTPPPTGPTVTVADFSYSPAIVSSARGQAVTFRFNGPSAHTASDSSGTALFNSGSKAAGTTWTLTLGAAGNFAYKCNLHSGMTGTVRVPISVSPATGTTATTFTVTWAVPGAPPAGLVYDVQIRRPGQSAYGPFRSNTTLSSVTWVPNSGPGTYRFRARVKRTSTGKFTGWSVNMPITVS